MSKKILRCSIHPQIYGVEPWEDEIEIDENDDIEKIANELIDNLYLEYCPCGYEVIEKE